MNRLQQTLGALSVFLSYTVGLALIKSCCICVDNCEMVMTITPYLKIPVLLLAEL